MTIPSYQEVMLPLLKLINEGRTTVKECIPIIADQFELSEMERQELIPSGTQTVIANRIHWARTYLGKAGALESVKRSHHKITALGKEILAQKPTEISNETLKQFGNLGAWIADSYQSPNGEVRDNGHALNEPTSLTPEQQIEETFKLYQRTLKDEVLEALYQVTPSRFEHLIVTLLNAMGFGSGKLSRSEVTSLSRDGGIDGIINEDALGLDAVYIQAKRYGPDNKVSRPDIQRFVGSLTGESATKGVFVTTSDFSREAREYIHRVQQRVVLINGDELARLLIQHNVGVTTISNFALKSIDESFFSDD